MKQDQPTFVKLRITQFASTLLIATFSQCSRFSSESADISAIMILLANSAPGISAFSFTASANNLSTTYSGTISGNVISIRLPHGKAGTAIPTFSGADGITVDGLTVTSGVTAIDVSTSRSLSVVNSLGFAQTFTLNTTLITPVPDTLMTSCYDGGNVSTCAATAVPFPFQDADFNNVPATRGVLAPSTLGSFAADYVNVDRTTGLTWKACDEGRSGSTCASGGSTTMTYAVAVATCSALNSSNSGSGFAGLKNWRLPTMQELLNIQKYDALPYFDSTIFPNAQATAHWTSSVILPASTSAMAVIGTATANGVGSSLVVKCVSGAAQPVASYTDNGDGTVTDNRTQLTWQKCTIGQTNDATCSGTATSIAWATALTTCKNLTLGGRSWRLPNKTELSSLADFTRTANPFVNQTYFPNTPIPGALQPHNWASTTNLSNAFYAHEAAFNQPSFGTTPDTKATTATGADAYQGRCVSGP
ncbi:MAG: DUF1566 domain-containing protein [Leptospirales bacterium]|nr:DUF1566 domain-containing protein [Leptospirales bacterium]